MSEEKTEKPTDKKKKDLRKKGVVARSQELPTGVALLAAAVALPMAARALARALEADMQAVLVSAGNADLGHSWAMAKRLLSDSATAVAMPILLMGAVGIMSSVALTRERPSMAFLKPKKQSLSPKAGFKRVFSVHGLQDTAKITVKVLIVGGIGYYAWQQGATHIVASPASLDAAIAAIAAACTRLMAEVGGIALLVGLADAFLARKRFGKQSKMSKQEVRDEFKQMEANPHLKQAMRQRAMRLSRTRMMAAIAGADVVLANPTHIAIALRYEPGSAAPVVVARGADHLAQRIKAEAAKQDVPIVEDKPLARALYSATRIGDTIPFEMFRTVAEVLATVYAARRKRGLPAHRPAVGIPKQRGSRRDRPTRLTAGSTAPGSTTSDNPRKVSA
jgi:flagellar biosynthetic protein FlhB